MTPSRPFRPLCCGAALLLGCTTPPASAGHGAALAASLDSLMAAHAQDFVANDLDAVIASYTDSAVVRPAGMEPIRGRDALHTALRAWLDAAPITALRYTTEDFVAFGDSAFHIASYQATVRGLDGAELRDNGSCALLWVWTAAGWQVHRSLCNSSAPPAPAQAQGS